MKNFFFNWPINDVTGWGNYGFNFFIHGNTDDDHIIPIIWPPNFIYPENPFSLRKFKEYEEKWKDGVEAKDNDYMLSYCGNYTEKQKITKKLIEIGVIFFENYPISPNEKKKLAEFQLLISGSSWNQNILNNNNIINKLIIQGVDSSLFRWQPKKYLKDKFVVYSGGKLEYRKGQDILVKAFSIFAKNRKDALLISNWRSPLEKEVALTVNKSGICKELVWSEDFGLEIEKWVHANDIDKHQFINLNYVGNQHMPEIYREVDLAVFPNRCEGGTNLVAMEALACGINSVISQNTGHLDIILNKNCIPLTNQSKINKENCQDWGESSIDELISIMEDSYYGRNKILGSVVSDSIKHLTWEKTISTLIKECRSIE